MPRADYRIDDVWDVVGLRGTGSNDLHVERAFVPAHRTVRNFEHAQLRGPGQKINSGPLYRMPFGAIFTSAVTAPVIGVVEGCLEAYLAGMRDRIRLSLGGGRFAEDQFAQVAVARAASEVDAAALQMDRNIRELHDCAARGDEIPMELRLRARRDQVCGTERALRAIDILFRTAGGSSLRRGNPIERAWRDAHAGSNHVANDVERALALYGTARAPSGCRWRTTWSDARRPAASARAFLPTFVGPRVQCDPGRAPVAAPRLGRGACPSASRARVRRIRHSARRAARAWPESPLIKAQMSLVDLSGRHQRLDQRVPGGGLRVPHVGDGEFRRVPTPPWRAVRARCGRHRV